MAGNIVWQQYKVAPYTLLYYKGNCFILEGMLNFKKENNENL